MIYVIGDSFAWGDEVADHILPNFWGYKDQLSDNQIASRSAQLGILRPDGNHPLADAWDNFRIENRWSNLLAKHFGTDVVNRGENGKSIHGMVTTLSQDFETLKNADLVIVQLTGLHRFQIPYVTDDPDAFVQEGYAQLNPLVHLTFRKQVYFEIGKLRLADTTERDFLYDYLNCILLIRQLVKSATNTEVLLVDSLFLRECGNLEWHLNNNETNPYIKKMLDLTDFKNKIYTFPSMADIYNQNRNTCHTMVSGHYCHNTHRLFAQSLYDIIIRENMFPKKH